METLEAPERLVVDLSAGHHSLHPPVAACRGWARLSGVARRATALRAAEGP
jgi:hypothetical protein